ncbi:MAG: polysaccharide deacetylase family protein [Polyangiaceae bacterium]
MRRFGSFLSCLLGLAQTACSGAQGSSTATRTTTGHPAESPPPPAPIQVAITVDDLPAHGPLPPKLTRIAIADEILSAFKKHGLTGVYGFVNAKKVDDVPEDEAVLRRWIAAGHLLGNHSYSHPSLHKTEVPEYLADIEKNEALLGRLQPSGDYKLFRYPFLFEGDTLEKFDAVRAYLGQHGYTVAEVTIDADDWAFNPPFARCAERGDAPAMAQLHRDFVEAHVEELSRMRELTHTLSGREVPQVVLLHIGAADAAAMDDLLTAYEKEGVQWIGLRAALSDPFYASDRRIAYRAGAAFPYVIAKARGVKMPPPVFARGLEERLEAVCR